MQDRYETEKPKSNRTSPIADDIQYQTNDTRRKGSIRFYDEVQQSTDETNKTRNETATMLQQDDSAYASSGYEYNENIPEYNQTDQDPNKIQQTSDQMYSQLDYTEQPYGTREYDGTQYTDQQNYDQNQYGTAGTVQPTDEYNYQTEYQGYEQQNYPATDQLQQPEQYNTEMYQDNSTKSNYDTGRYQTAQQLPNYTEPNPTTTNVGQKFKGNGNTTASGQRQSMSKQSAKKKFT